MASCCRENPYIKVLLMFGILVTFFERTLKFGVVAQNNNGNFNDVNISAILNSLQIGYDKRVRPNYGSTPVTVGVTMYLLSISSLSEVTMDFTLDMYFRQFWQDPRLSFERHHDLEKLVVGAEYINRIWVPDTFFVNEKMDHIHGAMNENQFLRILHTGEVLRSIRLTITASCPMNLQYFPMDRQLCVIEIESFGYTMSDIRYQWHDDLNSVQISPLISLPQFKVLGHRQQTIEASLSTGNYSRLVCEIQFVRSMGYYLIQIYIPSSIIIVISWVSFWLNRGATTMRVGLGVTTVLTMMTLMASTNAALPKISYVKSIDVYLGFCFFMVFASLIEYATVGYMEKRIQMKKNRFLALQKMAEMRGPTPIPMGHSCCDKEAPPPPHMQAGPLLNHGQLPPPQLPPCPPPPSLPVAVLTPPTNPAECDMKDLNRMFGLAASDIDKYSRIIFPVTFTCFQLMYWIIYQHLNDYVVDDLVYLHPN